VALSHLGLLVLAVAAWPAYAAAATVSDGQAAYDSGRFQDAVEIWSQLAEQGDARAQFNLGLLYDIGAGVEANPTRAFAYYERAATAGLPTAEFNVGVMYDSGRGIVHDASKAASWYSRAAARGHTRAAFNIGQLYETGDGVPQNLDVAEQWYGIASAVIPAADAKRRDLKREINYSTSKRFAPPLAAYPVGTDAVLTPNRDVELVWLAPPEPNATRFFVELREVRGGNSNEVYSGYTDLTAIVVPLNDADRFAWRVYAVAEDGSHYSTSGWNRFTVTDDTKTRPAAMVPDHPSSRRGG
jgi:tetratricopeptide (TPR) repeat protein